MRLSTTSRRYYDVAISYASEDAEPVGEVVSELAVRGIRVFSYPNAQDVTWGQNLRDVLRDTFQKRSALCVAFISKHSATKPWPAFERQSALARPLWWLWKRSVNFLPVRLDDTVVPEIDPEVVFLDLRKTTPRDLALEIKEKLAALPPPPRIFTLRRLALLTVILILAILVRQCFIVGGSHVGPAAVLDLPLRHAISK